jgi:hypothetical protein
MKYLKMSLAKKNSNFRLPKKVLCAIILTVYLGGLYGRQIQ